MQPDRRNPLTLFAWAYAAAFGLVVLVGHLPGVNDAEGRLFGLFNITLYQDLLHGGSALWAAVAAWRSPQWCAFYFRWFGSIYLLDGIVGAILGVTLLDAGIFIGKEATDPSIRVLVNVPHILIGGSQALIGFVGGKRWLREGDRA